MPCTKTDRSPDGAMRHTMLCQPATRTLPKPSTAMSPDNVMGWGVTLVMSPLGATRTTRAVGYGSMVAQHGPTTRNTSPALPAAIPTGRWEGVAKIVVGSPGGAG